MNCSSAVYYVGYDASLVARARPFDRATLIRNRWPNGPARVSQPAVGQSWSWVVTSGRFISIDRKRTAASRCWEIRSSYHTYRASVETGGGAASTTTFTRVASASGACFGWCNLSWAPHKHAKWEYQVFLVDRPPAGSGIQSCVEQEWRGVNLACNRS